MSTFRAAKDLNDPQADDTDGFFPQRVRQAGRRRRAPRLHVNALYYDRLAEESGLPRQPEGHQVAPAPAGSATPKRASEDPVRMLRAVRLSAKPADDRAEDARADQSSPHCCRTCPIAVVRRDAQLLMSSCSRDAHLAAPRGLCIMGCCRCSTLFSSSRWPAVHRAGARRHRRRVREGSRVSLVPVRDTTLARSAQHGRRASRKAIGRSRRFTRRWTMSSTGRPKLSDPEAVQRVMKEIWVLQPRFEQRSVSALSGCSKPSAFRAYDS